MIRLPLFFCRQGRVENIPISNYFNERRIDLMKKLSVSIWPLFLSAPILTPSLSKAQATHIGSRKCMSCHSSIYET
jgi:hypothetical protein